MPFFGFDTLTLLDGLRITQPGGGYFDNHAVYYKDGTEVTSDWVVIQVVPGDVNGDGVCNAADVTALYNWILNGDDSQLVNGDQNGDNEINAADVTAVYNIILGINP